MIPPGSWLGLLGGGQLGRMFCMAAQSLGYRVAVLDPGADGPAAGVADRHLHADYLDEAGLNRLAALAAAVTTEFENVPAAALDFLARSARVSPSAASVSIAQDRTREKSFLAGRGFAVAPHAILRTQDDARRVDGSLLPGIVKSARMGYDGKGQIRVRAEADVPPAFEALGGGACVLERYVDLACEVSVVVARDDLGATTTWPVAENRHRDGILDVSIAPARIDAALDLRTRATATAIATALDYRGVLCVEFFVARGGELLVNELAPRPHNSGHYTIDACATSQFEQQARILAALPMGDTRQLAPAVMVNLLGDLWFDGPESARPREPAWQSVLALPLAKLHLYGKHEPRRGRKMGHVTCLGATIGEALDTARSVKLALGVPGADELLP
ncbi:MAG: 5-(carboxyamino)imidazole ribonucleotide synthase [Burkholderiales bacterium]|nr:5-(carboxyamino)imidazole ribonucleotide synthase [Burkholderiales bacterium]